MPPHMARYSEQHRELGWAINTTTHSGAPFAGNLTGKTVQTRQYACEDKFRAHQTLAREHLKQRIANSVTVDDVIKLFAFKVPRELIVSEIKTRGVVAPLTID